MTWQFTPNTLVTGGNEMIYEWMKQLVALGFVCAGSGDGNGGTFENIGQTAGPYDIWTQTGAGTGSYVAGHNGNDATWYRLRFPDGVRELVVARYGQYSSIRDSQWKMFFSKTGFDNNDADAENPPTASAGDARLLFGTDITTASTSGYGGLGLSTAQQGYIQVAAEDAALNGFHAFYCTCHEVGSASPEFHFMFEALTDIAAGDTEPYLVLPTNSVNNGWFEDYVSRTRGGILAPGSWVNGIWNGDVAPMRMFVEDNSSNPIELIPREMGINADDSNERLLPVVVGGQTSGYKGIAANIKWVPTAGRAYPDTYDSLNYLVVEGLALPWDGSTVPLT